jgi:hypothetical protein
MVERVILMCAGRAERWGKHRGTHKHLVSVNGEMLLDRTLRLVRRHTAAPIVIVAFDPEYARPGGELFAPRHGPRDFCDTDKFLSSEERWGASGDTILLYGDVFFTHAAMKTIVTYDGPHQFFGRREGSYFTGCPWRELFALRFQAAEREWIREQLFAVKSKLLAGDLETGGGWALYEQLYGGSGDHFTVIDDFTEDFDFPQDFETWLRRYRSPLRQAFAPIYSPTIKSWYWRLHRWNQALRRRRWKQPESRPNTPG